MRYAERDARLNALYGQIRDSEEAQRLLTHPIMERFLAETSARLIDRLLDEGLEEAAKIRLIEVLRIVREFGQHLQRVASGRAMAEQELGRLERGQG